MWFKAGKLFQLSVQESFEYRGQLLIWVFESFFIPIVLFYIWSAVLDANAQLESARTQLTTYYLILPIVTIVTSSWHGFFLAREIRHGVISNKLIRPLPVLWYDLANNLTEKIIKLFLISFLLAPAVWHLRLTFEIMITQLIWLPLALVLGLGISFTLQSIIAGLAFWFDDVSSLFNLTTIAEFTFGGRLVPLFFFPPGLHLLAMYTPYRYIVAFPLELISTPMSLAQIAIGVGVSLFWLSVLVMIWKWLWHRGLIKYAAAGG